MSTTIRDRIGAATGAAFVVLAMVGNEMASGSSGSARPTGEQVLSDVARQASSTAYTVGFVLEGLAFVAFIGFLGYLTYTLRRARGRGPAGLAAVHHHPLRRLCARLRHCCPLSAPLTQRQTFRRAPPSPTEPTPGWPDE